MTPLLSTPPRSILIVRLSARGDIVFASPLVRALRRTWPDATIVWAAESHTRDLVAHHPELDDVVVWDRQGWKPLLRSGRLFALFQEFRALRRKLRSYEFDVALDLQGLLRSAAVARLSGAPVRIGIAGREGGRFLLTRVLPAEAGGGPEISSEYRFLAEALGLDVADFRMEVHTGVEDDARIESLVAEHGLEAGYAVAAPFTTRPQKHWVEARWPEVIDRIQKELDLPVVLLGGPSDRDAADRIVGRCRRPPLDLVGRTRLSEAAAAVKLSRLFVGVDTGLTHMAIAFDRPTVTIFGSSTPYRVPPNERTRLLFHRLPCQPCGGNPTCLGAFTCMTLVTPDEVMEALSAVQAAAGIGAGSGP